jgi:hypothetical protein
LLFNLRDDPAERNNVAAKFPQKAEELHRRLKTLRQPPIRASRE